MDKVNLPVPGSDGPVDYDNSYLIFDRAGIGTNGLERFRLTVADLDGLIARKAAARNTVDLYMSSGRPYGMIFLRQGALLDFEVCTSPSTSNQTIPGPCQRAAAPPPCLTLLADRSGHSAGNLAYAEPVVLVS